MMSRGLFCIACLLPLALCSGQSRAERILERDSSVIESAARIFNTSARLLASVIYAEQLLNVMPGEPVVDAVLAKTGYNSSIGAAQVKVETARWIERQLKDPLSQFYLGDVLSSILPKSTNTVDLVDCLTDDSLNVLYEAAYVKMIEQAWSGVLLSPKLANSRVGIIASLYSMGLLDHLGRLRSPHNDAKMTSFGTKAQGFYDSPAMRRQFPT